MTYYSIVICKISIDLQSKSNDILKAVNLLKNLKNVVLCLRDSNMVYEGKVGEFCSQAMYIKMRIKEKS